MEITLGPGVKVNTERITQSPLFRDWAQHKPDNWNGTVTVVHVDEWDEKIQTLYLRVSVPSRPWPDMVVLRSETVDVLTIIHDGTRSSVVFVRQVREAVGGRAVYSNIAGGKEWTESVEAAAWRELYEELGLESIDVDFQVTLSDLLPRSVLATPGMINERVYMLKTVIRVDPADYSSMIRALGGKQTGVAAEGEELVLVVIPAADTRAFIEANPPIDAKTVLSLCAAGLW